MQIGALNRQWLGEILGLPADRISDVRHAPLGAGQVADTYRASFQVAGEGERHLVLKLTSTDAKSLRTGKSERSYLREVRFYQQLAQSLPVRVPRCRYAEVDEEGTDFVLVLEDLSASTPGDQLRGCTVDEAAAVLSEAARLHAPRWNDPTLNDLSWLPAPTSRPESVLVALSAAFEGFCRRYREQLDDDVIGVGRHLFGHLAEYYASQHDSIRTVQHGDFRLDNLLFGTTATGEFDVAVVDWQTVCQGPGVLDVSYFLGGGLLPDERKAAENDLLRHYHGELLRLGVTDYDFEECRRDYVRFAFHGYFVSVLAAMAVKRTERGDQMFPTLVQRAGRQILDVGAVQYLG